MSDALLAAKLPLVLMAAWGLALTAGLAARRWPGTLPVGSAALAALSTLLFVWHRPAVIAITRDPAGMQLAEAVARVPLPPGDTSTLVAPWGHSYWALAYAREYWPTFPAIRVVDHNADVGAILADEAHLLVLDDTLYRFPLDWWTDRLGPVALDYISPRVLKLTPKPETEEGNRTLLLDLGNGIGIASATVDNTHAGELRLTIRWQARRRVTDDYAVGVHLLSRYPPAGPQDVLAQADKAHPVGGWYPTTMWDPGEVVSDLYVVPVPADTHPMALSVGMYRVLDSGGFANTPWLDIPISRE